MPAPAPPDPESDRWAWAWRWVALAPVILWATLAARSHATGGAQLRDLLLVQGGTWLGFVLLWRRSGNRQRSELPISIPWLIGCGLVFRLCGLGSQPVLEDDQHRFLWDGWQLRQGRNPYATVPAGWFGRADVPPEYQPILNALNHPDVPTVYGPVAQLGFAAAAWLAPAKLWPWKTLLLLAEIGLWSALAAWARAGHLDGRDRQRMWLLLTGCPLAVFETSFNAHPEMLAIAAAAGALALLARGSPGARFGAGILLGTAVAAKSAALPLLPWLWWRGGPRLVVGTLVAGLVLYAPFCGSGGRAEFTGLQIMARDWEFNSTGYAVLAAGFGPSAARGIGGIAILLTLVWCGRQWSRSRGEPVPRGDVLFGIVWWVAPTANPWYFLWLLPFVAYRPTWPGLTTLAAVSLAYVTEGQWQLGSTTAGFFEHPVWVRPLEVGLVVTAAWVAARAARAAPTPKI